MAIQRKNIDGKSRMNRLAKKNDNDGRPSCLAIYGKNV